MITNYILLSLRKFKRQKFYSLVNLFGLTVGLTSVILIMLFVIDEVSYDRFHAKSDRIYRVVENQYYAGQPVFPVAVTPVPLGPSLREDFGEIQETTRLMFTSSVFTQGELIATERGAYVDTAFFSIFSFEFINGDPASALKELDNVILTEKLATKYFGNNDCIGEQLKVNTDREMRVSAVIKDFPNNSHIHPDFLMPFEGMLSRNPDLTTRWGNNMIYTYALLGPDVNVGELNQQLIGQIKKNLETSITDIYLQPLTDIHLGSVFFTADVGGKGNMQYVSIFFVVALFILVIACINFMNLATARSMKRSKEVGLRKSIGATKAQLIFQFLSESVATTLMAMAIAILLVDLLLPQFNLLAGKNLTLNFLTDYSLVLYLVLLAVLTGLVAGSYPALFLSSFQPAQVLKSSSAKGSSGVYFRKVLVVIQFGISIVMIAGTFVVYQQIQFIRSKNLGYRKENVVKIPRISNAHEVFKSELTGQSGIMNVSATNQHPAWVENSSSGFEWEGYNPEDVILFHLQAVDFNYVETMGMELTLGRSFSREFPADTAAVLLNEEAVRLMNFEQPIGQKVYDGYSTYYTVVGVLKDFHFKSIHQKIEPLILFIGKEDNLDYTMVRISPGDPKEKLAAIESVWKKFNPGRQFVYTFLDDDFNEIYKAEEQTGIIFKFFSGLAIMISCLGLFGLASFTMEQRTKEFGVRKVFGASFFKLFSTASWGFIILVMVAFALSVPVSLYFITHWLDGFAYHVSVGYEVFLLSGLIAFAIALLTVSYQSIKSALINPAECLRHE